MAASLAVFSSSSFSCLDGCHCSWLSLDAEAATENLDSSWPGANDWKAWGYLGVGVGKPLVLDLGTRVDKLLRARLPKAGTMVCLLLCLSARLMDGLWRMPLPSTRSVLRALIR